MERIIAYKCEYCKKVLRSYSGMHKHEEKCFYNTKSKSCITCQCLESSPIINNKKLSEEEIQIFEFKKEGTYKMVWNGDPEGDGLERPVLNDEYKYLYDAEDKNYCNLLEEVLCKLRTNCDKWI